MMGLLGGWKWPAIAFVALTVLGYIGYQEIVIARQETRIATLTSNLDTAVAANRQNASVFESREARHEAELKAITADRDRIARSLKTLKVVKQEVAKDVAQCVGVPGSGRRIMQWVRQSQGDH